MPRCLKALPLIPLFFVAIVATAAEEVKPVPEPRAGEVLAEFQWRFPGEPILARVKVDEQEHFFVVDTGATYTVLDSALRDKLGSVRRMHRTVIGNITQVTPNYALKATVSVNGVRLAADSDILSFDLTQVRQVTGLNIRGVLGMQFLRKYVLRLDYDRRKAQLLRAEIKPSRKWGRALDIREGELLLCPYVIVGVDGAGARPFLIDTGGRGIGVVAGTEFKSALCGETVKTIMATAAGSQSTSSGRGSVISLGGFGVASPLLTRGEQNVTGLEMLSRFTVTMDLPRKKIYLKPGKRIEAPDPGYLTGLRLMREQDRVLVHSVLKDSQAEKAELNRGDELLECNGRKAGAYSLAELRGLGADGKVKEMALRVRREKREFDVKVPIKDMAPVLPLHKLHAAVLADDLELLKRALKSGTGIDELGGARTTALQLAATLGRHGLAAYLLKKGANARLADGRGFTPLHVAAATGDVRMMEMLLRKGVALDAETSRKQTGLHLAAAGGFTDAVKLLLRKGAPVDVRDQVRATPMFFAAAGGHVDTVKLLLAGGASPQARAQGGGSLLQAAASNGRTGVMKLLYGTKLPIETVNDAGATALHWAASRGQVAAIDSLLAQGAKVDALTKVGTTPLHAAAHMGRARAAARLLKAGANVAAVNKRGEAPLHFAAVFGQQEVLELLLANGSRVDGKSKAGMTPLLFSLRDGHDQMALYLMKKGADVKAKAYGTTVMHAAAGSGSLKTIEKLIADGFNLEAREGAGNTPLHTAVWAQKKAIVELLLAKGAKVNVENKTGSRPLDLARHRKNKEIEKLLLRHGAKERNKLFIE